MDKVANDSTRNDSKKRVEALDSEYLGLDVIQTIQHHSDTIAMTSINDESEDPTRSEGGGSQLVDPARSASTGSFGTVAPAMHGMHASRAESVVKKSSLPGSADAIEQKSSKLSRHSSGEEEEHEEEHTFEIHPGDEEEDHEEFEEGEEEEDQEEFHVHEVEVCLDRSMLVDCLKLLCKIGNGMAHALVRLDAADRGLTNIDILRCYIHLRYVDVSKNKLRDVSPLGWLDDLLTVCADFNLLEGSIQLLTRPYMQVASFANNALTECTGLQHPLLDHLNLNHNMLSSVHDLDPNVLGNLHTLELRGNKLTTTASIQIPTLKSLFLAANDIVTVEGMDELVNLTVLHLRDNKIRSLNSISEKLVSLQYINCRSNNVANLQLISRVRLLPNLKTFILSENPISESDEYRTEVLARVPHLDKLDKEEVGEDEKMDAVASYEERKEEFDQELLVQDHPDPLDLYETEPDEVVVATSNIGSKSDISGQQEQE